MLGHVSARLITCNAQAGYTMDMISGPKEFGMSSFWCRQREVVLWKILFVFMVLGIQRRYTIIGIQESWIFRVIVVKQAKYAQHDCSGEQSSAIAFWKTRQASWIMPGIEFWRAWPFCW
jgi:hypothetical protein